MNIYCCFNTYFWYNFNRRIGDYMTKLLESDNKYKVMLIVLITVFVFAIVIAIVMSTIEI